ncbi:MAG: MerR family DNA-binding protein [Gammaproteobacteria bacterium]|nr:MerR family DNA-binding protein [Gammaproteobacteria bacterium]
MGVTLNEIRALLDLADGETYTCAEVKSTLSHADDVRRKVADLRRLEKGLRAMAAECDGGDVPECPVVDLLFDTAD